MRGNSDKDPNNEQSIWEAAKRLESHKLVRQSVSKSTVEISEFILLK